MEQIKSNKFDMIEVVSENKPPHFCIHMEGENGRSKKMKNRKEILL